MISIKGLSKVFTIGKKEIPAVDSLSLDIAEGDIYGVIGYSGAGKSTFVRLLNRLEEPTKGKVIIDGKDMMALKSKELRLARQEIGMIFQHFNLLWSRTTEENIAFPLEVAGMKKVDREKRVQELIDLVGLTGREKAYPAQLSGGQKQRVGIARALANNPKVLLCDEATSALDPETTKSILSLLVDINQKLGLTIVLITHEMNVIQKICSKVAVMEDGAIVEQGDVLEVFSKPKQPVTKKFVEQVVLGEGEGINHLLAELTNGKVLRLHFYGTATNETLISHIAKNHQVEINIVQAKVTLTQSGLLGTMVIHITGEKAEINQAMEAIKAASVELEMIQDEF